MSTSNTPTFEEVDKHIRAADLSAFQPGGKHHLSAAPSVAIPSNVCAAYKIVRPFLVLAGNTPIFPATWRTAIKAFIGVMDIICP